MRLDDSSFLNLIRLGPLVSIDFLIKNIAGHILLGLRKNAPAKGFYFVPGGRIQKNETFDAAVKRISIAELKISLNIQDMIQIGCSEQFYQDNFFETPNLGTHYIAMVFAMNKPLIEDLNLDEQHETYTFMSAEQVAAHPQVHPYCKDYLRFYHATAPVQK